MIALIDGDIIVRRVGHASEDQPLSIAISRVDDVVDKILEDTKSKEFQIYLSDKTENGFRVRIYPEYKANRVQAPPVHFDELKEHLIINWNAAFCTEQEADDGMGIAAFELSTIGEDYIVCTSDKDLNQIPGDHFNFVKGELFNITEFEGMKYFYRQLLSGDTTDNIPGIWRIGPMKAEKILEEAGDETDMFLASVGAYREWLQREWKGEWDDFKENQMLSMILIYGRVLKIRQEEDEFWNFPKTIYEQPACPVFPSLSSS